jgi:hypothetical protein
MDGPSQIINLRPIKSANQYLYHYTRADSDRHSSNVAIYGSKRPLGGETLVR